MAKIRLGARTIDQNSHPYIIAEIGVNHENSMDKARELIDLAKEGGADAAKFQSYKADTLASRNSPAYWDTSMEPTRSQFELFSKYDSFGPDEYVQLAKHCEETGIEFLSTPFDHDSVDFLEPLVPFYKIASADITNIPLLRKIAQKGNPVVLSTGASMLWEIDQAIEELKTSGCGELALLHCVLNYPTSDLNAHIDMIQGLRKVYPEYVIGYSDHTLPDDMMFVLTTAYIKGAKIIEKHFTDDKTLPGNDHYHAMDVDDLKKFQSNAERLSQLEGNSHKQAIPTEQISREHARRSIVVKRPLNAGVVITPDMLICKRPAHGISPLHWDDVIGVKTRRNLEEDHILQWEDLSQEK